VIREKKASLLSKGGKVSEAEDESRLGGKKRQALMDLLLDLHVNGQQIMEQDIREEVDTFMFEVKPRVSLSPLCVSHSQVDPLHANGLLWNMRGEGYRCGGKRCRFVEGMINHRQSDGDDATLPRICTNGISAFMAQKAK
ncbi:hypothetical protein AVEN_207062-1, partial [Araneus ventricosus]